MKYFVTAIGTDSGKTVVASALALALKAHYWKPIQAGFPTDSNTVRDLTNKKVPIIPEKYVLETPASPHYAAEVDHITLSISDFKLPEISEPLIVEGAGGCLVPINDKEYVIDLVKHLNLEIVLVSNNYLGSINHTLLTIDYLKNNELPIKCIIFNGPENPSTEDIIMKKCNAPCLLKVKQLEEISVETVHNLSIQVQKRWHELDF